MSSLQAAVTQRCALVQANQRGRCNRDVLQRSVASATRAGRRKIARPLRVCASARGEGKGSSDDDQAPAVSMEDWRAFRARLVASEKAAGTASADNKSKSGMWAHGLAQPEPGCLLLSHPKLFVASQTYFFRAVIFLFEHSSLGSAGLILNRPTEYRIGQIDGAGKLIPQFSDELLYLGGDVGRNTMHLLHRYEFEGSKEVIPGVCIGGFESARTWVEQNKAAPGDFRFFTRYCGWGPGQLQSEVERGVWSVAAASQELILSPPPKGGAQAMWEQTLTMMGPPFDSLAKEKYGYDSSE